MNKEQREKLWHAAMHSQFWMTKGDRPLEERTKEFEVTIDQIIQEAAAQLWDDPETDGTPYQHPAYTRGEAMALHGILDRIEAVLNGSDTGAGTLADPRLEVLRQRLLANRVFLNQVQLQLNELKTTIETVNQLIRIIQK